MHAPAPDTRSDVVTCDDVINACQAALDARKKQIAMAENVILQQMDKMQELQADLDAANRSNSAFYRNPYLLIGLGVITGIFITK